MLDTSFPNSPAWLEEGGPNAMALHLGALAYSDQHGLDGVIPGKLVPHVSLAVSPGDIESALGILLEFGFWTKMSRDKYAIKDYERTNFTREQAEAFREREATKKRRQRLHTAGDHSLCTSAKWCPAVKERERMSPGDTRGTRPGTEDGDTRGPIPSPIPYQSIRPLGSMDGMELGGGRQRRRGPAKASAGAPAKASPEVDVIDNPYGPPPPGISLEAWVSVMRRSDAGEFDGADPAESLDGLLSAGGAGR